MKPGRPIEYDDQYHRDQREEIDWENDRFMAREYRILVSVRHYKPWASTSKRSEEWEEIRQQMSPRPRPHEFINQCELFKNKAFQLSKDWTSPMLKEYVQACLLMKGSAR